MQAMQAVSAAARSIVGFCPQWTNPQITPTRSGHDLSRFVEPQDALDGDPARLFNVVKLLTLGVLHLKQKPFLFFLRPLLFIVPFNDFYTYLLRSIKACFSLCSFLSILTLLGQRQLDVASSPLFGYTTPAGTGDYLQHYSSSHCNAPTCRRDISE